jgi:hypothetical protein
VYPFLFPSKLKTQDRKTYAATPATATESADRHWILVQQPGQAASFDLFDANNTQTPPSTVTIPAAVFTSSDASQLKPLEWSSDNRHVLFEHQYKGGNEFIVVDVEQPDQSFNVNKTVGQNPTLVTLRDKKFDRFYLFDQNKHTLDYAEQKAPTVKPVLSNVLAYKSHGADVLLYVTDEGAAPGKTRVMLKDNDGSFMVREAPISSNYLLAIARYDNKWYVAAGGNTEGRVYVYKDPQSVIKVADHKPAVPVSVLRADNPDWLEFSANTQFIAMRGGQNFAVYDAENDKDYRYALAEPIDAPMPAVSWMDGNRIMVTSQGKMVVFDYDGINVQTLSGNQPGITPFFDRDYKLLYNIGPAISGSNPSSLTQTDLRVTN